MASFRIPATSAIMSKEAKAATCKVKTLLEAGRFLDTYGSHVSSGRHLLGGMFFSTIHINSEKKVDTTTLMNVAADKLQETKKSAYEVSGIAGGGNVCVTKKGSISCSNTSSSGNTVIKTNAKRFGQSVGEVRASFRTYVASMGPTAATPEHFVQALSADRSTWRVMDRGPFEALVPITEVIDNTVKDSLDSLEIEQLQMASSIIRVAYRQRVGAWKDLAKQGNQISPSLKNMILRELAQVITHEAILAAVVDLFEVVRVSNYWSAQHAAEAVGRAVLETAQDAKDKKAGDMAFFDTLQDKINSQTKNFGVFSFERGSERWLEETNRANNSLSSSDWNGFAQTWEKGEGTKAIKSKIESFICTRPLLGAESMVASWIYKGVTSALRYEGEPGGDGSKKGVRFLLRSKP